MRLRYLAVASTVGALAALVSCANGFVHLSPPKTNKQRSRHTNHLLATSSATTNALLVEDEEQLREFARQFLIPYGKSRFLQLTARRKYASDDSGLKQRKYVVHQSLIDFRKGEEQIVRDLRKLEAVAQASLYTSEDGSRLAMEWMNPSISAYPLDDDDACDEFLVYVLDKRKDFIRALRSGKGDPTKPILTRVDKTLMSMIHKSPCRTNKMLKIDIDTKDPNLIGQLQAIMSDAVILVAAETHSGYHVVLEKDKACQNIFMFAKNINKDLQPDEQWVNIESHTSPQMSIPGTNQGGFTVRLVTQEWRKALQKVPNADDSTSSQAQ